MGSLFAAFLGYNPIQTLLGPHVLGALPAADRATLTGQEFFPHLISQPFHHGLVIVFTAAIAMSLVGAAASLLTGPRAVEPHHVVPHADESPAEPYDEDVSAPAAMPAPAVGALQAPPPTPHPTADEKR